MSDNGMNPDQIERVFGSLARIEQKIDTHTAWMTAHVAEDKIMAEDIQKLRMVGARQKGYLAAIGTAGGVLGAVIAAAADFFGTRGHH
jgi:hypothetical protein